MSYILDALRKSDQLRRRNAAPTLLLSPEPAALPRKPAFLAYGALGLVLLAAGIAIGWLRPWQPTVPNPGPAVASVPAAAPAPAAPQPVQTAIAPTAQPRAPSAVAAPRAVTAPVHAAAPAQPQQGQIETPVRESARLASRSAGTQAAALHNASKPGPAPASEPRRGPSARAGTGGAGAEAAAINMADLPLAIQQELPAIEISVHAYSGNAADRLVGINGHLLHEGDSVAPGLTLERITPDGMILDYKGYRFRHGVR